jgi:hypothetical protein
MGVVGHNLNPVRMSACTSDTARATAAAATPATTVTCHQANLASASQRPTSGKRLANRATPGPSQHNTQPTDLSTSWLSFEAQPSPVLLARTYLNLRLGLTRTY